MLSKIEKFMRLEAASGITLLLGLFIALIWANSTFAHHYHDFIYYPIGFYFGDFRIQESLQFWVNDALMAFFFYIVSLEIKREMYVGELSTKKKAALPIIAALGGMLVPAVIYFLFNKKLPQSHGWGIPTATDIAFSIGVLTLLGNRIPFALKTFLLTLAVADDLGGIIIIAVFYAHKIHWTSLIVALIFFAMSFKFKDSGRKNIWVYLLIVIGAWISMLQSGVHASITGVMLGFMTPIAYLSQNNDRRLHSFVNFLILPLFALVNTGITFSGIQFHQIFQNKIFQGVALGLTLGKPIGISLATWLAIKFNLGELPNGIKPKQIVGIGFIAGIGFTVATFIGHLALQYNPTMEVFAKLGILTASIVAAIVGSLLLR